MRSAAIITTLCAGFAVASPFHRMFHKKALEKKDVEWAYVTDIVTDIVIDIVTAGQELPSSTPDSIETDVVIYTVFVNPLPPTTTSTTPPPPPPTTQAPAPTTEAPAPTTTTPAAAFVEVAPSSAPVASSAPAPLSGVAQISVDSHNGLRSKHSANGLAWNDTLAGYAAI